MSNNPPPNIIWLQWDGDAETPEPCTDDPDDRDVTWCRERVFARDIQFERSARIKELDRELEKERALADRLRKSAQALVDRWETPFWKDAPHTAKFIRSLDDALAAWKEARSGDD